MSPSERKKMVMDLYKRFKGQGDASIKGGKHQIMLATEDYATVVLEDADDAELNRIYTKYDVANWLKKFGKTATEFATPEALEKYLKSHPNADKSKHSVKKDVSYVPKRHPDEVRKEVNSEAELREVHQRALDAGLVSHLITDLGMTEFHGVPTLTCCAIGPHADEVLRPITGHLSLY